MLGRSGTLDHTVERLGRWTAGRMSRRSFLGRLGRGAVLVAAGPSLAVLLAERAEARVCGQSGVSQLCPTFDCVGGVWGWCWYATGCCAHNRLKKICDCCAKDWPNVHGYCPDGTNVKCAVESCGLDPRVQQAWIKKVSHENPGPIAAWVRSHRYPKGASRAVVGDVENQLFSGIATAFAGVVDAPVFLARRGQLSGDIVAELHRLKVGKVFVVGSVLPLTIDVQLTTGGFTVERVGLDMNVRPFSGEVADYVASHYGKVAEVCIEDHGLSAACAPVAAAFANARHRPLVVGGDTPGTGGSRLFVGRETRWHYDRWKTSSRKLVSDWHRIGTARQLCSLALSEGFSKQVVVMAPRTLLGLMALAGLGRPILLHEPHSLDGARGWLYDHGYGTKRVYLVGWRDGLWRKGFKELQAIVNGFETRYLIGKAGQGLPVIEQPHAERPIGRARKGTDPPPRRR